MNKMPAIDTLGTLTTNLKKKDVCINIPLENYF